MKTKINKPWYQSKTKWAGVLSAIALVLPGAIDWLSGGSPANAINGAYMAVTALLALFGIRDALN